MPRRQSPPESALMLPVLRAALRAQWASQMTPACVEIPWYQKRLDLAFVSADGLVVVELKVTDWRRAIKQAFVNRWIARASWVALWHENVSSMSYEAAHEAGVGILVVTRRTAYPWVIPGPPARPDDGSPIRDEIIMRGTCIRDLLGDALGVHRAAFA
jgi:hypothetical protein